MPASVASCSLPTKVSWRPTDLDWVPRVARSDVISLMAASTMAVVAPARTAVPAETAVTAAAAALSVVPKPIS